MSNIVSIRGRESKSECALCGTECESVVHMLWECSVYNSIIVIFWKASGASRRQF